MMLKGIEWPKKSKRVDPATYFAFATLFLVGIVTCEPTTSEVDKMFNYLDEDVNACDDFYEYACGNYVKNVTLPNDGYMETVGTITYDLIMQKMQDLLRKPSAADEIAPFKLVKKLYNSCMDPFAVGRTVMAKMDRILKELGGWPLLPDSKWQGNKFNWKKTLYKFRKLGIPTGILLPIEVKPDQINTENSKNVIHVNVPEVQWEPTDEELLALYKKDMLDMAVFFGATKILAEKEIEPVIVFERQLAKIQTTPGSTKAFSIQQLNEKYTSIPWLEYINGILDISTKVTNNDVVNVADPNFVSAFEKLLKTTNNRTIANYVVWRAVKFIMSMMAKINPPVDQCIADAESMNIAIGALYARTYLDKESKAIAEEIVVDIKYALLHRLDTISWSNLTTKKHLIQKIEQMTLVVGYPNEFLNDTELENYYRTLEFPTSDYIEMKLNLEKFHTTLRYDKWQKLATTDWTSHLYSKGYFYYSPDQNALVISAGTLQGRIFEKTKPAYRNYGSLGVLAGMGFLRAFDHLNQDDVNLWYEDSAQALKDKQCFIQQYGSYREPRTKLFNDGRLTLDQNIIDDGAMRLAYSSFVNLNALRNPLLSRLLFWISAAQSWCSKYSTDAIINIMTTSTTSIDMFRINGAFSNNEDFANDFSCPIRSRMNPKKKCRVW